MKVLIVGASRGIGLEFVRQYRAADALSASGLAWQIDTGDSVAHMRRVIAALTPSDNGRFFDHDGTPIDW